MPPKRSKKSKPTSNLPTIIADFTRDLTTTFPEYAYLWEKWTTQPLDTNELKELQEYFSKTMPERFFDILYQNEDIFLPTSEVNTFFLPNVEFKLLYNCENITANTKNAIWKYLQLILFTLTSSMKDKTPFGESMDLFNGIDETELQSKITEAISGIGDFFKNIPLSKASSEAKAEAEGESEAKGSEDDLKNSESESEAKAKATDEGSSEAKKDFKMPNSKNIFDNLKKMFDGKIGKMASELANEMTDEFKELFGEDESVDSNDMFKKLMKDPKKLMSLVQKVSTKVKSKFQSGEVNQDEMMKEATEFMKQFKDMGGANSDQFKEMFQNMTKGMGLPKNAKMDVNALSRMEKQMAMRERMKKNVERKREEMRLQEEAKKNLHKMEDGTTVFRLDGEKQEKSMKETEEILIKEFEEEASSQVKPSKKGKKGK